MNPELTQPAPPERIAALTTATDEAWVAVRSYDVQWINAREAAARAVDAHYQPGHFNALFDVVRGENESENFATWNRLLLEKVRAAVPQSTFSEVQERFEQCAVAEEEQRAAEQFASRCTGEEAQQRRQQLLRQVNWPMALQTLLADDQDADPSQLFESLAGCSADTLNDVEALRIWSRRFEEQEVMLPEGETNVVVVGSSQEHALELALSQELVDLREATQLAWFYLGKPRRDKIWERMFGAVRVTDCLADLANKIELNTSEPEFSLVLGPAIRQVVGKVMEELYADDRRIMQERLGDMPNTLFIGGATLLAKTTTVDGAPGAASYVQEQLSKFPTKFVRGLGAVGFTGRFHRAYCAERKVNQEALQTAGKWNGELHGIGNYVELNARNFIDGKRARQVPGTSMKRARASLNQRGISGSFAHELGHHMHAETFSFADLVQWIELTRRHPVDVSDYVARWRSDGVAEHKIGWEDFADSIRLYTHYPELLLAAGDNCERFMFFNRFFGRYDARLASIVVDTMNAAPPELRQDIARELGGALWRLRCKTEEYRWAVHEEHVRRLQPRKDQP